MDQELTFRIFGQFLVLFLAAYAVGALFASFRQPRVIGELLGGFVLGPSVLGAWFPAVEQFVFPDEPAVAGVLGALYQAGLLCLLFVTGSAIDSLFMRRERRASITLALAGLVIPFLAGLAAVQVWDMGPLQGTARNHDALVLVFASAIAITSIPVISRILLDLRLMHTRFARIILGTALIEDVALYAILAVAVGIALGGTSGFGLAGALQIDPGSALAAIYYAVSVAVVLLCGFRIRSLQATAGVMRRVRASAAATIAFVLAVVCGVLALSLPLLFGGIVAGIAIRGADGVPVRPDDAQTALTRVAMSSLVPFYFAVVGFRIDISEGFDWSFTLAFIVFACLVKAASVYGASRYVLREAPSAAWDFAIALNARGGPGIVLAAVALDADIISTQFYATLIALSVATSMLAGAWLERAVLRRVIE